MGKCRPACSRAKTQEAIVHLTHALNLNPQDRESRYYLQVAEKRRDGFPVPAPTHP
jgi:predicted ATPase